MNCPACSGDGKLHTMLTRQNGLDERSRECDVDQLLEGRDVVKPLNLQNGLDGSNRDLQDTTRQA